LEDEAMKKEAINHALHKRLRLANQLLEAEGVDAVEASVVPSSVMNKCRSSHRRERQHQSTTNPRRTRREIMFAITEIFCNHDVEEELDDLTCHHFSEAAEQQQPEKESPPPHSPLTDRTVITDDSIQVAALQSEKELLDSLYFKVLYSVFFWCLMINQQFLFERDFFAVLIRFSDC
jgi:hypothetical protein